MKLKPFDCAAFRRLCRLEFHGFKCYVYYGQAAKNGITIQQFRYCALDCNNCGTDVEKSEVMKSSEMQCINAISALFPYLKDPDSVIHPLFDSVRGEKFSDAKIHLVNSDKRYHHTW